MKKITLLSALALAGLSVFPVCSFVKSSVKGDENLPPTVIILIDSSSSVTLQSTLNRNTWEVPATATSNYLALVAQEFGKIGLGNFQEIQISFSSDYTKGVLVGFALDQNGARVPIGVEYKLKSQSGNTTYMRAGTKHTCAGDPCSCYGFQTFENRIIGCYCYAPIEGCTGTKCNHTVTTTE